MKTCTLLAFIAAASSFEACAFAEQTPTPWSFYTSTFVMKDYYGAIVGGTFYPGTMSFTDFGARRTDAKGSTGFDLSLGQKLDNFSYNKDGGNEYDFTVDRSTTFTVAGFPVKADFSVCYLAVHDLRQIKDDVLSPDVRLDFPKVPFLQPYIVVYRFDRVGNSPEDSGWFFYGGFIHEETLRLRVNGRPIVLTVDNRIGYSEKLFGTEPGLSYDRLSVSLRIEVAPRWTITPILIEQFKGDQPKGYAFADRNQTLWAVLVYHPL